MRNTHPAGRDRRTPRALFRSLRRAAALLCLAAASAAAQNTIDHIATMTAMAPGSGMYASGMAGASGPGASAPVTVELVRDEARVLASGQPADQLLAGVLSGGPATALASTLTGAGAPEEQVAALMSRLSALAYSPGTASLKAAMQAFNALVRAAPAAFVKSPPAQLLSIRTALIAIWAAK